MILQTILLVALVLLAVLAILARDLIKSAIALAAASVLLGIVFFRLNAPFAGVFEISVVAGLITVLFMLTIALTSAKDEVKERKAIRVIFPAFFVLIVIADILVMRGLLQRLPAPPMGAELGPFGRVLWTERTFDLVGQLGIILAGVFAVLALFRKRDKS